MTSKQPRLFAQGDEQLILSGTYRAHNHATIYAGDRLELIQQIHDAGDKAQLIVTSPPYNIGKEYETQQSLEDYLAQQERTIAACVNILAEEGSICWQVGHYIEGSGQAKEAFPLDLVLYPIFKSHGLILKNRIIWTFGHGLHEKTRFSGRHETILWFVRSEKYVFNLDPVRVPQKYPGKKAFRGKNKGKLSGHPAGKNPSDIWDMPNVKANHKEKTEHPCQYPVGLVERLILSLSHEGDLVLDPYLGAGTTVATAVMRKRRGAGSDIEPRYIDIATARTRQAFEGVLPHREMNQPIYTPNPASSIASQPTEWTQQTFLDQSDSTHDFDG